jgi:hypothetical protein
MGKAIQFVPTFLFKNYASPQPSPRREEEDMYSKFKFIIYCGASNKLGN